MTGWLVLSIAAAAMIVGSIRLRRRYTTATVRGTSMVPTFGDGTRVLAARRAEYRVGDVVVFRTPPAFPGDPAGRIKRIAAAAGDPVPGWLGRPEPGTVPAGCVVVAGDNPHSQDSRQLGFIQLSSVAGRVIRVLPHRRR